MDSHLTEEQLLTYHLGACTEGAEDDIETHLCACPACLRVFLRLKRHSERGRVEAPRPSPEARARIYASVRATFKPTLPARVRGALGKPIPLYQGIAALVVAAALAGLLPQARGLFQHEGPSAGTRVDTARVAPESLTIY
jgi:hypothetical protein